MFNPESGNHWEIAYKIMIVFKQLEIKDVIDVAKNAIDALPRNASEDTLIKYAEYHKANGAAYTGYINNQPVLVTGFHRRHKNDGVLWSIISKDALKHKKTVFKSLRLMLECFISSSGITKMLAETKTCFPEANRLLEHLGFVKQRRTFNKEYDFYKRVI